jgi:hypothetical protein
MLPMLRTFRIAGQYVAISAAVFAAAVCGASCADLPANPLRAERATVSIESTAQPSVEPPSVVPHHFGEPELLPPGGQPEGKSLSELGAAADLSLAAPWHEYMPSWFDSPWFAHGDPNDPLRHIGIGQPLSGTSWRNRPWFFGTFVGGVMMDDIVSSRIYQNDTTLVGARLGYDFDHFWGLEARWAFARPDLTDSSGAPLSESSRDNFGDVSMVYYPLGDARWRPYLLAGLGFTTLRFNDEQGRRVSEAVLDVPLGVGVKYFYSPWFTLRFDFVDNIGIGNARVSGMSNVSLMAGAEFRFGGRRPSYFPWHNNTSYW